MIIVKIPSFFLISHWVLVFIYLTERMHLLNSNKEKSYHFPFLRAEKKTAILLVCATNTLKLRAVRMCNAILGNNLLISGFIVDNNYFREQFGNTVSLILRLLNGGKRVNLLITYSDNCLTLTNIVEQLRNVSPWSDLASTSCLLGIPLKCRQ